MPIKKIRLWNVIWYRDDGTRDNEIIADKNLDSFVEMLNNKGLRVKSVMVIA